MFRCEKHHPQRAHFDNCQDVQYVREKKSSSKIREGNPAILYVAECCIYYERTLLHFV